MTYDQAIAIPGARYVMTMKDRSYFIVAEDGGILFDSARQYNRLNDGQWNIVGIGRRWNSRDLYSLEDCAKHGKRVIGHGFVHDRDHGYRRVWMMPRTQRVVSVEIIERRTS
jgi:hypothetical protein